MEITTYVFIILVMALITLSLTFFLGVSLFNLIKMNKRISEEIKKDEQIKEQED